MLKGHAQIPSREEAQRPLTATDRDTLSARLREGFIPATAAQRRACFCSEGSPLGGGWVRGASSARAEDPKGLKPRECDTRAGQGIRTQRGGATARPHKAGVWGGVPPRIEHAAQRLKRRPGAPDITCVARSARGWPLCGQRILRNGCYVERSRLPPACTQWAWPLRDAQRPR